MKDYLVMIINAVILIILGGIGFIMSGSPTALIADGAGLILLLLAIPAKNENHVAAHIAVAFTLITAISFIIVGIKRGNAMIIVMGMITFTAFDMYILSFIQKRKKKKDMLNNN